MNGSFAPSAILGLAGGRRAGKTRQPLAATMPGVEHASALWLLVGLEILTLVGLRRYFRRQHGG